MHPHRHATNDSASRDTRSDRALVACSLWLYAGFIGAAVFGAGLILHFGADTGGAATLAAAIGGGVLALASWTRARAALERAAPDTSESAAPLRDSDGTRRDRSQPRGYAAGPLPPGVHTPLQPR